jgi:hypothetical protein
MQVNNSCPVCAANYTGLGEVEKQNPVKFDTPNDSIELSSKNSSTKTTEEKQEILQKARTKAAGWSILFTFFDTLYYGLRSDKKVAKQFDLDPQKDKNFIKTIKRQQMLSTLPSLIPGLGIIPGAVCWLYNKNLDPSKLEV